MLDLKGIKKTFKKLSKKNEPGETVIQESGRPENRYSYFLNGKMAFTFGITRGSRGKSIKFRYVPKQMGLSASEYQKLHDCPLSKKEYNEILIESKKV